MLVVTGSFAALQSSTAYATEPGTDGLLAASTDYGTTIGNADGTGQHVPAPLAYARDASWSSDGSRIAWQNIAGTAGLVVSDPDGTNQVEIPNTTHSGGPTWFDSNTKLVFEDDANNGAGPTQLYVASVTGTGPKTLLLATDPGCADIRPLAHGNLIVFTRLCTVSSQVWLYDQTTGTAHMVLDRALEGDISPDGTKIVFSRVVSGGGEELFESAIDGSGVTKLTTTGATQSKRHEDPAWSPSGTRIAYYSNGGANGQDTEVFDLATKTETVWLAQSWGSPSWQPINPSAPKPPAPPSDLGTYYPMSPYRILDTRTGLGGPHGAVGDGGFVNLQVTGSGGVPADASTVVLNVTVTEPTGSGFVTVYPEGVPRPNASSLNFTPGWTGANSVTVKIGYNGRVDLFNAGGSVQLVADVFGYYTKGHTSPGFMGGQYHPLSQPLRLTDTREWGLNTPGGLIPGDAYITSAVDGDPTVLPHIRAFAVNVTATQPAGSGFLTAWNGSGSLPGTSTVNYTAGATVPNFAVVPTAPCVDCGGAPPAGADGLPSIGVYTTTATHIIVDLVGYYDDGTVPNGLRFSPNVPTRIADTRIGQGWPGRLGWGETASILTPSSIANADTRALALNVTGVLPTQDTFLTVWPSGSSRPDTSNLNPTAGSVVPNAVQTGIAGDDRFNIFNAGGFCDVVVDVVGTFYQYPPTAGAASSQVAPALMKVGQSSTQFKRL